MIDENSRNYPTDPKYNPQEAVDAMSRRFYMGVAKHGEWTWKKGDWDFVRDRAKHAIAHTQAWLDGDETDPDNLAGAICDLAIVIYHDERERIVKQWAESDACEKLGDS